MSDNNKIGALPASQDRAGVPSGLSPCGSQAKPLIPSAMRLPAFQFRASEGWSLGGQVSPDNNRRSLHEGCYLNAAHTRSCVSCYDQLDRRRRLDRGARRGSAAGLIGRRDRHGILPNRASRSSPEPKLHTEAASGGQRYSASASNGLPAQLAEAA